MRGTYAHISLVVYIRDFSLKMWVSTFASLKGSSLLSSINEGFYSSLHTLIHPSTHPSIHLSSHPSIHPSIYSSIHPFNILQHFIFCQMLYCFFGEGNGTPLQYSCLENPMDGGAWWAAVHGVTKSRTRLSSFTFTFHFHALEKEMASHSSVLAWRIPGTGEPGGLRSMGSHRVRHN